MDQRSQQGVLVGDKGQDLRSECVTFLDRQLGSLRGTGGI